MGAYDCDCINNLEYDRRERKAQLSQEGTTKGITSDLISRQAAIDAIMGEYPEVHYPDWYASIIKDLPTIQPEPAIPVSWVEGQIERLNNTDNYFAKLTANIIKTMLNEWRKGEPNE